MQYITKKNQVIEYTTILENPEKATLFQHFKGNYYKILTIAKDCETLEEMIVYQGQYDENPCWTRKIDDYFSEIDQKKYPEVSQQYRFQIVEK